MSVALVGTQEEENTTKVSCMDHTGYCVAMSATMSFNAALAVVP